MLSNDDIRYYPLKVYCYNSIKSSIVYLLKQPGMQELCKHWQSRVVPENTLADVYDGNIWKKFKGKHGDLFFDKDCNIGLIFNSDWFPPFERTPYSVSVLFAVI